MPDPVAAVADMERVLRPGERLAASAWKSTSPLGLALYAALDRKLSAGTTSDCTGICSKIKICRCDCIGT